MAFVAPLALSGAGGALFGQTGAAIGWLVGSWLFQPKQQDQNKIFDPGAEELPRFNSALRGATMPFMFGTNRVPAQVVWQHDFTTIRKETSEGGGGGGKFGGSGMKGPSGASSNSISYQYKWDIVYHFGMVPEPYSLYGGWLGPDRLSADTILAITNSSAGSFNVFFGFSDEDAIAQKASLIFEQGFFYQGAGHGSDDMGSGVPGWDEITSDEALIIRWPHTVWVGFKQLDLGAHPHVPQLSFEIGPGSPIIDFETAYVGSASRATTTATAFPSGQMITGDDGEKYLVGGGAGSVACTLYRYDVSLGTYTLIDNISSAEFDADATALGLDPGTAYDFTSQVWGAAIPGHNYFVLGGYDVGSGTRSNRAIVLYKVDGNGAREALGGYQARSGVLQNWPFETWAVSVTGEGNASDPLIAFGTNQVGATFTPIYFAMPPITAMDGAIIIRDDANLEWDDNVISLSGTFSTKFGDHTSHRPFTGNGWFLPEVSVGAGLPTWTTRLSFYVGKSDIEWHIDNPGSPNGAQYIYDNTGNYPNGFITYASLGVITWDGNQLTVPAVSGPTIDNANFIGLYDENVRVPFDDAGENRDGTVDDNDDYMPSPTAQKLTEGQASGAYLIMFAKAFTGSEDMDPTGDYIKVRGFIYNPLSGKSKEFGTAEGSPWDTVADIGAASINRNNHTVGERRAVWDEETSELFIWDSKDASDAALDITHFGQLGSFDLKGGSDVLPPYIIYQILTNAWGGLGKTATDVDQSSYQAALLYCESQGFRVSVQYRRDENALDIIEELLSIYGGFLIISNGLIKFKQLEFQDGLGASVRTIDNDHLVNKPGEQPVVITPGAKQDTYNKVRVSYFDRLIDYQPNQVEEGDEVDQDLNGVHMREFPARFVMSEQTARTMTWRALWSNLYSRDTYEFGLGWKDSDLEPGDVITLVDSHHPNIAGGVNCRIVNWREKGRGEFDVTAKQEFEYISAASSSPLSITSASAVDLVGKVPSPRFFNMYELPAEFQLNDNGAIYCGWLPDEFAAGAYLWVSPDGVTFAEAAKIEPYVLGGQLLSPLPVVPVGIMQENVEVVLFPKSDYFTTNCVYFNATLNEAGPAVRAVGGSLMWIGSEMIAYESVTLLSQNKYRFSKVYRGWGGTPIGAHSSGDFWWKHGGGIFTQDINEDKISTLIQYKVQPFNLGGVRTNIDSIDAQTYTIIGAHYLPQVAPTPRFVSDSLDFRGKTTVFVNSTVDIPIDWRDSARKSGFGVGGFGTGDYGRFTIDPQSHSWRVEVVGSGDVVVRSTEVTTATYTYTSSNNFADNGAWRGTLGFKVTPFSAIGDAPRTEVLSLELW